MFNTKLAARQFATPVKRCTSKVRHHYSQASVLLHYNIAGLQVLSLKSIQFIITDNDFAAIACLEELEEVVLDCDQPPEGQGQSEEAKWGLLHFPEAMKQLTNMTHLTLSCHYGITALPQGISRLNKLEVCSVPTLCTCRLHVSHYAVSGVLCRTSFCPDHKVMLLCSMISRLNKHEVCATAIVLICFCQVHQLCLAHLCMLLFCLVTKQQSFCSASQGLKKLERCLLQYLPLVFTGRISPGAYTQQCTGCPLQHATVLINFTLHCEVQLLYCCQPAQHVSMTSHSTLLCRCCI